MNKDEPLVKLDFDETNTIAISQNSSIDNIPQNTQQPQHQQRHLHQSSLSYAEQQLAASITAAATVNQPNDARTISTLSGQPQQSRPSHSGSSNLIGGFNQTEQTLVDVTTTHTTSTTAAETNTANRDGYQIAAGDLAPKTPFEHQHSLISLASNSSDGPDSIHLFQETDGGDNSSAGEAHDDLTEINLLADCSMDSRESQPLLGGSSRDTHDYVYNSFPGNKKEHKTVELCGMTWICIKYCEVWNCLVCGSLVQMCIEYRAMAFFFIALCGATQIKKSTSRTWDWR